MTVNPSKMAVIHEPAATKNLQDTKTVELFNNQIHSHF
jgi:hypothetical protein